MNNLDIRAEADSAPQGDYVRVPRTVSREMLAAGDAARMKVFRYADRNLPFNLLSEAADHAAYRAMLSATPSAPSQGGWRGIESAPRDGTSILVWGPHGHDHLVVCWDDNWRSGEGDPIPGWGTLDGPIYGPVFTHWMPLPPAPPAPRVEI